MAFFSTTNSRSAGYTWQGVIMMLCLMIIGVLQFNIFGNSIALIFLPVAGISLWPSGASPLTSVVCLFFLGLGFDFLSGGPFALWSIIFLTTYAVFRPFDRSHSLNFGSAIIRWVSILIMAGVMSFLLAWFGTRHRPDLFILLYQLAGTVLAFPFIYGCRKFFRSFVLDPDDRGF